MTKGMIAAEDTKRIQKVLKGGVCVHMNVCLCKERGTEQRPLLQERETITGCLFTSQSTQAQVDPTTEEQSVEEIKKKKGGQTAQSKHMYSLTVSSFPQGQASQCTVGNAHIH